jgi:hypothetical protein
VVKKYENSQMSVFVLLIPCIHLVTWLAGWLAGRKRVEGKKGEKYQADANVCERHIARAGSVQQYMS